MLQRTRVATTGCKLSNFARRSLAWTVLIPFVAATLAGCSGGVIQPQGPIASANAIILLDAVGIMAVIVVPTIAAVLGCAWWYRASNTRAQYLPHFVYSGRLELLVWAIPLLVITFLGGVIWVGAHQLDPFRPIPAQQKPMEVQVISLDWKWLFIYPEQGIASVNELVVPAGRTVHFSLTSASVMNMFFVPQLGSMVATMNGMVTQLHLRADHPGDYYGQSSQYSGNGFSGMHFVMRAVQQAEVDRWIAAARASGPALDRAGYGELAKQSQDVKPFTYRAIDPNLFKAVARLDIAPAPGPAASSASAESRPQGRH